MIGDPTHSQWSDWPGPIYYARVIGLTPNRSTDGGYVDDGVKNDSKRLGLCIIMKQEGGHGTPRDYRGPYESVISGTRMDSILGVLSKWYTSGFNDQISVLELNELMEIKDGTITIWSEEYRQFQLGAEEDAVKTGWLVIKLDPLNVASLLSRCRGK